MEIIPLGSQLSLGQSSAGLSDVSDAVRQSFQPVTLGCLCSKQIDGYTQTIVEKYIYTRGARVEIPKSLIISKTGERIWQNTDIYFMPEIMLKPDDLFLFNNVQFRVITLENWPEYGYNRYHVIQDYTKVYNFNPNIISPSP